MQTPEGFIVAESECDFGTILVQGIRIRGFTSNLFSSSNTVLRYREILLFEICVGLQTSSATEENK